jgi:hypothetical protein
VLGDVGSRRQAVGGGAEQGRALGLDMGDGIAPRVRPAASAITGLVAAW